MSHPEEYDVVVLGSGRARFFAWSLASQGTRVAVVERRNLAGSCPTIACALSKNVIHGAKVANYFRKAPNSASPRATGKSRCQLSATASGRWSMALSLVMSMRIRERRGACQGAGPLRRAENDRGDGRRRYAHPSRRSRRDLHGLPRGLTQSPASPNRGR